MSDRVGFPGSSAPSEGPGVGSGTARYQRAVRKVQAAARIPAVSVALHRDDRELWTFTVGTSGDDRHPLDAESRVRIGSVTKTFTAQLWSTAGDMARWAAFLASPEIVDPGGTVLSAATVDEMRWPLTTTDEQLWAAGFGLGLILQPQTGSGQGGRPVHVGHAGAMPGFLAGVYGRRGGEGNPGALGCAALGSSGTAGEVIELAHELLRLAVELDPADIRPWAPGRPAPAAYRSILGPWWSEGTPFVFTWHDGTLQARAADAPADRPPAVFQPLPGRPDVLRTVSGREAGERLRLTRDEHGVVVRMHWATYRFTRVQEAFDGVPASEG